MDIESILAIISIMSGFLIVGLNEFFAHRRDIKQKKKELRISHLENTMNWLNEINKDVFTVSKTLDAYIYERNQDRKEELSHLFSKQNNELMEKCIVYCTSYGKLNRALNLDLDLDDLRKKMGKYTEGLRKIKNKYIYSDNNTHLEKINSETSEVRMAINKRIDYIAEEIMGILLN